MGMADKGDGLIRENIRGILPGFSDERNTENTNVNNNKCYTSDSEPV